MSLRILGINGSLRESSYGARSLAFLLESAAEFGAEVRLLHLGRADMPMYNPDGNFDDPRVVRVLDDVTWAQSYVLASPDYHGSMSGAIKNFLDYHWTEFAGKLFAHVCSSHEKGLTVMDQMRTAVCHCYGWSLPYGVSIHGEHDFDEAGNIRSPRLRDRLRMMANDLVTYGTLLHDRFLADIAQKTPETFAARY